MAWFRSKSAVEYNNDAITFLERGDYRKAIAALTEAIRRDPGNAQYYNNRGKVLGFGRLGRHEEAIADFDTAIRINPKNPDYYWSRGCEHFERGQTLDSQSEPLAAAMIREKDELAVADFTRVIQLDPQRARAYANRGMAQAELRRHEAAFADYQQALRLDADLDDVYFGCGVVCVALRDYAAAVRWLDEAIRRDPQVGLHYTYRGMARSLLGQDDRALGDFDTAIRLDPKDALAYTRRGEIWHARNDDARAFRDFSTAIELGTGAGAAFHRRGELHYKAGRYREAVADYTTAFEMNVHELNVPEIYHDRACAYRALGETELAAADLRRAKQMLMDRLKDVAKGGKLVGAVLVQANRDLFSPGEKDLPCFVLISFDPRLQKNPKQLLPLAEKVAALKGTTPEDPELRFVADCVTNESFRVYERNRLPASFTGGAVVYHASLQVYRSFLPEGHLASEVLWCVAEPGDQGRIELVPYWVKISGKPGRSSQER